MSNYNLGKDVQQILEALERIEKRVSTLDDKDNAPKLRKKCCCSEGCCSEEETAELFKEEEIEVEIDGEKVKLRGKTFGPWSTGRLCDDFCNWKDPEYVTIWSDGYYENTTEIKCEHGWLFACYFEDTMNYKDKKGGKIITTTTWDRKLAGGDSTRISGRRYSGAIRRSFNKIKNVTRSRYTEC